jgi:hypothetical protein
MHTLRPRVIKYIRFNYLLGTPDLQSQQVAPFQIMASWSWYWSGSSRGWRR